MKIAFSGTHITGKTTLLNDFRQFLSSIESIHPLQYKTFGSISGIARSIMSRGFPLNKDGNMDSYVNYINDQLEAEKKMLDFDIFISDRTLLSPLAYSLVNKLLPRPYIPEYFISMLENIWLLEKERYDLYIYFPIEYLPLRQDSIHPEDEEYRQCIDTTIHALLVKHNINHIHMTGSKDERLNTLIDIVTRGMSNLT